MNNPVGATNPELRGNVQLYTYGPGGSRGDVDTLSVTFATADEDGLEFFSDRGELTTWLRSSPYV